MVDSSWNLAEDSKTFEHKNDSPVVNSGHVSIVSNSNLSNSLFENATVTITDGNGTTTEIDADTMKALKNLLDVAYPDVLSGVEERKEKGMKRISYELLLGDVMDANIDNYHHGTDTKSFLATNNVFVDDDEDIEKFTEIFNNAKNDVEDYIAQKIKDNN